MAVQSAIRNPQPAIAAPRRTMLHWAADRVVRWRWGILAGWVAGAALLAVLVPAPDPRANEGPSLLPSELPSQRAVAALGATFPRSAGLSQAVVIFERPDDPATATTESLSEQDYQAIASVSRSITQPSASPYGTVAQVDKGVYVTTPASDEPLQDPYLRVILESPIAEGHGQAVMMVVQIPASYITMRASDTVNHVQYIVDHANLPKGLQAAVTGSASFGHDYAVTAQQSHERTLWITVVAVVVILLLVYRAPLAALVPLAAISLAAVVAACVLAVVTHWGMHVGGGEKIFVYVLLYGAGIDYSLFLLARYREALMAGQTAAEAMTEAYHCTMPAILASAATTIAGMLMLMLAQYRVFRTVGPAVAVALLIALLASLTLLPALAAVLGRRLFWLPRLLQRKSKTRPRRRFRMADLGHSIWRRLAVGVTGRPLVTLLIVLAVLAPAAVQGARAGWVYDSLVDLHESCPSVRGLRMAVRHWPVGELTPITIMVQWPDADGLPALSGALQRTASQRLNEALLQVPGVVSVRSYDAPLGTANASGHKGLFDLSGSFLRSAARPLYATDHAALLQVITDRPPFSREAMDTLQAVRRTVNATLADSDMGGPAALLAGANAEMLDLRSVTQHDFWLVAAASLAVIALIVLVMLRDVVLSLLLVASTLLGYLATLGVTHWAFVDMLGRGLDWKVEVFLFVVMVAVGQDYNIYLAVRLAQEGRTGRTRRAARRAIIATGGIISSCGLIMAATLGSLMAGDLLLLKQLGFAFAVGMLLDTFVLRPLMVPALAVLTNRTGRPLAG